VDSIDENAERQESMLNLPFKMLSKELDDSNQQVLAAIKVG
jgi:hypothetical protein